MMKRIFCLILSLMMLLGCAKIDTDYESVPHTATPPETETATEFIGVWIPIYEIAPATDMNAQGYADKVSAMMKEISDFNITDVFLQVRANCDALYPSEYFSPSAKYCNGGELKFDALKIITEKAHENNLKLHAWINPYRISATGVYDKENCIFDYICNEDIAAGGNYVYIKPSSSDGRKLVIEGVREIIENYCVDGIHIDDYFYPTTDESFDEAEYSIYIEQGGMLSLADWRRENVNILLSSLYSLVKNRDENLMFSVSPSGNIDKNYNDYYADVELWCRCEGFADMIIPQIYYGFENSSQPFEECLNKWKSLTEDSAVKLSVGLAVYKADSEDQYAGEGRNEWKDNDDIIKRQIECVRKNGLAGFSLFSYNYIFSHNYLKNNEIINMKSVI